jgi:hypothetical protein
VIYSTQEGKLLHVDLEDCTLMGCKIFGAGNGEICYSTKGDVKAYVQFQQAVPNGMHRLGHWPVEVFQTLLPRPLTSQSQAVAISPLSESGRRNGLRIDQPDLGPLCEVSPVVWKDRLVLLKCNRPASGGTREDYFLTLEDVESGQELARFGTGYGLASAFVWNDTMHVFASRYESGDWNDVTSFKSNDLKNWTSDTAIAQEREHLFNSSVTAGEKGFVMAYESNDPNHTPFTIKFAVSTDLETWTKVPDALLGPDRYAACPAIRYAKGYYYVLYLEHRSPRWFFETFLARSKDLKEWELSPANPILTPGLNDGINASDPDLTEYKGQTYLYYSAGDQRTWSKLKRAVFPGEVSEFLGGYFSSE